MIADPQELQAKMARAREHLLGIKLKESLSGDAFARINLAIAELTPPNAEEQPYQPKECEPFHHVGTCVKCREYAKEGKKPYWSEPSTKEPEEVWNCCGLPKDKQWCIYCGRSDCHGECSNQPERPMIVIKLDGLAGLVQRIIVKELEKAKAKKKR